MPQSAPPTRTRRALVGPSASVVDQLRAIDAARVESKRSHSALKNLSAATRHFDRRQAQREMVAAWRKCSTGFATEESTATATLEASWQRLSDCLFEAEAKGDATVRPTRLALANLRQEQAQQVDHRKQLSSREREAIAAVARQVRDAKGRSAGLMNVNIDDAERCAKVLHVRAKANEAQLAAVLAERQAHETEQLQGQSFAGAEASSLQSPCDDILRHLLLVVASQCNSLTGAALAVTGGAASDDDSSSSDPIAAYVEAAVSAAMVKGRSIEARLESVNAEAAAAQSDLDARLEQHPSLTRSHVAVLAHAVQCGMGGGPHGSGLPLLAPPGSAAAAVDLLAFARLQSVLDRVAQQRSLLQDESRAFAAAVALELSAGLAALRRHKDHDAAQAAAAQLRQEQADIRRATVDEIAKRRAAQEAADAAHAQAEAEAAAAEAAREAMEAKRRQEENRAQLAAWSSQKQLASESDLARRAAEEAAAAMEAQQRAQRNAERVALRDAMRAAALAQANQQREEEAEAAKAHQLAIQRFLDTVEARLGVAADPERAQGVTVSKEHRDQAIEEEVTAYGVRQRTHQRQGAPIHGFTTERVAKDPRARMLSALSAAGLASTPYAQAILRGMSYVGPAARTSAANPFFA